MRLNEKLPIKIRIDGKWYLINTDYRIFIRYEQLLKKNLSDEEILEQILLLFYPEVPDNYHAAANAVVWFYNRGEEEDTRHLNMKTIGCNGRPAYDLEVDAGRIYAAFQEQYGIDLFDIKYLHWWKFLSLLECLSSKTKMGQIMEYRTIDVDNDKLSKDEKKFYKEMQNYWSLDRRLTKEERIRNEALIHALKNGGDIQSILEGGGLTLKQ